MMRKKKNIFEHLGSFVHDPLGMKEAEKKKKEQKKLEKKWKERRENAK